VTVQPHLGYRSLQDLMARHRLLLPEVGHEAWRLTPPYPRGQIRGLPETQGWLICTTGVLCYVLLDAVLTHSEATAPLFLGHLDSFLPDREEHLAVVRSHQSNPEPKARLSVEQLLAKYGI
jgi:hypothetical protein